MARSEGTTFSCAYLHRHLHIPAKYLQSILTALSKQGLLRSGRGRSGGYQLRGGSCDITLLEIIEAVEGMDPYPSCFFGFGQCPLDNPCAMHDVWARTHEQLIRALSKTRLADLVQKSQPG